MKNLRSFYAPFALLFVASAVGVVSCASQDPGAFEVLPRFDAAAPPGTIPTVGPTTTGTVPVGDAGTEGGLPGSAVFATPYAAATGPVVALNAVHMGNGGPTDITMARTSGCNGCHGPTGTAPKFLAAGVANAPNIEIGLKLGNGTVRTTRSGAAPNTIFYFTLQGTDTIANAKAAARDGARETTMTGAVNDGSCNQGACHGGGQGLVFK